MTASRWPAPLRFMLKSAREYALRPSLQCRFLECALKRLAQSSRLDNSFPFLLVTFILRTSQTFIDAARDSAVGPS